MPIFQIVLLALVQGMAELLPVSSSAHVIVAQKLMGLDPASPPMTFLLVMLHTGTMFAVIKYFWPKWKKLITSAERGAFFKSLVVATGLTGVVGFGLKAVIEHVVLAQPGQGPGEVRELFRSLPLIAGALFAAGIVITIAGIASHRRPASEGNESVPPSDAGWIGVVQGLCLPFRGFSRSGATISTALLRGIRRDVAEDFSFALAVLLTPAVIVTESHRLIKSTQESGAAAIDWHALLFPGFLGMFFSFLSGLLALKWLSSWLEHGRWHYFGIYCFAASAVIYGLSHAGF